MTIPRTLILLLLFAFTPASAQDTDPFAGAVLVRFGVTETGRLDGLTTRAVYQFDGRRGEFLSVRVTPTEGNLDPVLTVVDDAGTVLAALDDGDGRGALLETLRVPRNGLYTLVIARFGGELGTTAGDYELFVERVGVSSQSGSSLRYDDTVVNTITDETTHYYYSFQARRGDILTVRMQRISGELDPLLQIVNSGATVLAASDDVPGTNTLDAAVERLVIEADGTYVIVATRYGEGAARGTTGSFVLSLAESTNSGLGNTLQTAANLPDDRFVQGEITEAQAEQYFTFVARENDLVRLRMDRLSGTLDAYLVLLDEDLRQVAVDDDGGGGRNAQLDGVRLPRGGRYYVQATRFADDEAAPTVGTYRLSLERLGGAFEDVQPDALPVRYGSTVTGVVDETTPRTLYAFYGTQGDVVTVAMNRGDGNLDPVVALLGNDLQTLLSDDDSGGGQNAQIERFVLGRTGLYYIEATRYTGPNSDSNTRGGYILVLAQVFD